MIASFSVHGHPAPQGSKVRFPNGGMREASPRLKDWRSAVAAAAADQAALTGKFPAVLLEAHITFRFPMPKNAPKADRENGARYRLAMPDLDKLIRSTFDGLKAGGLITDDAHFATLHAYKIDAAGWTGAKIVIREM